MVTIVLSSIIAVLVGAVVALLHQRAHLRAALDAAEMAARSIGAAADTLAGEAKLQKRRADEFFGIIEGVEKERDLWQGMYRKSSHAAGVAQAWLLRDLGRAVKLGNAYAARLREKGERVDQIQVDPGLEKAVEEFSGVHVTGAPTPPQLDAAGKARELEAGLSAQSIGTQ